MAVSFDDMRRLAKQHARSIAYKWRDVVVGEEDLEQEGLIIGWQVLESCDLSVPDEKMFSYLHKRMAGRMRDVLRTSAGRTVRKSTVSLDEMLETDRNKALDWYSHSDTPEYLAQVSDDFLRVYGQLSEKQKTAMLMFMQGYSGVEVADALSVSQSRVSQLWNHVICPELTNAMNMD